MPGSPLGRADGRKKNMAGEIIKAAAALYMIARKLRKGGSMIDAYNGIEKVIAHLETTNDSLVPNAGPRQ